MQSARADSANRETTTCFRSFGYLPEGLPLGRPRPVPERGSIAFARRFDAGTHIWRVDVQTGNVQRVTRPDR
jgi:hypothetical protein